MFRPRMTGYGRVGAWLALGGVVVATVISRWRFLTSQPWPTGVDGFYYAVQLRSLLQHHQLYYKASPMAFWLLWPAASALGPIDGLKLGASVATALLTVPVYAIVARATRDRISGLLGATLIATAAGSSYVASEFVKQGVGLTLALGFVAAVGAGTSAVSPRERRAWLTIAGVLLVAALLTHLTSIGIALVFLLPPALLYATRGDTRQRRRRVALVLAALAILAIAIFVVVPAVQEEMGLAHLFGPATSAFTGERLFHREVLLGFIASAALLLLWRWLPEPPVAGGNGRAFLMGPAIFGILLAVPWLSVTQGEGLVFRLRVMAFVPLAICAPVVVRILLSRYAPRMVQIVPAFAGGLLLVLVPLHYSEGVFWPSALQIVPLPKIAEHTPANAIVVVNDRWLAFQTKWFADREATRRPPAANHRPTFRLASLGVLPASVRKRLPALTDGFPDSVPKPVELPMSKRTSVYLFPESAWQELLRAVSPPERAKLEPWPGTRPK
jgi:hypothetical protein